MDPRVHIPLLNMDPGSIFRGVHIQYDTREPADLRPHLPALTAHCQQTGRPRAPPPGPHRTLPADRQTSGPTSRPSPYTASRPPAPPPALTVHCQQTGRPPAPPPALTAHCQQTGRPPAPPPSPHRTLPADRQTSGPTSRPSPHTASRPADLRPHLPALTAHCQQTGRPPAPPPGPHRTLPADRQTSGPTSRPSPHTASRPADLRPHLPALT